MANRNSSLQAAGTYGAAAAASIAAIALCLAIGAAACIEQHDDLYSSWKRYASWCRLLPNPPVYIRRSRVVACPNGPVCLNIDSTGTTSCNDSLQFKRQARVLRPRVLPRPPFTAVAAALVLPH